MGKTFKDLAKRERMKKTNELDKLEDIDEQSNSLEPYTSNGKKGKYQAEENSLGMISKKNKEEVRNANRSLKKAARQKMDKQLRYYLDKLEDED